MCLGIGRGQGQWAPVPCTFRSQVGARHAGTWGMCLGVGQGQGSGEGCQNCPSLCQGSRQNQAMGHKDQRHLAGVLLYRVK